MVLRTIAALCLACSLLACSPTTTNSPTAGASTATTPAPAPLVADGGQYSVRQLKRIVFVNGSRSLKDQHVDLVISADGATTKVMINGKSYDLARDDDYGGSVVTYGTTGYAYLSPIIATNDHVWMFRFAEKSDASTWSNGYENLGSFVVGYETNPADIVAKSGSAQYVGAAFAEMFIGPVRDVGEGTFTLDVDFSDKSVSGQFELVDFDTAQGTFFPGITISMDPANAPDLAGTAFSADNGQLVATFDPVSGEVFVVTDQGAEGQLYGPSGTAIGGTFWIEGTADDDPMVLQGGFASP